MKINFFLHAMFLTISYNAYGMMVQKVDWTYPENFNVAVRIHTADRIRPNDGVSIQYFPMKKSQTVGDLQKNIADWLRVPFNSLRVMATKRSLEGTIPQMEYPNVEATLVETTKVLDPIRQIINDMEFGVPILGYMIEDINGVKTPKQYTLGYYPPCYDVVSLIEAAKTEKMIEQFREVIAFGEVVKKESIRTYFINCIEHSNSKTRNNDFSEFK